MEVGLHKIKNSYSKIQTDPRKLGAETAMQVAHSWSCKNKETPSKVLFKLEVTELPVKVEYSIKQKGWFALYPTPLEAKIHIS